jgi:hypothetical protein
MNRHNPLPYTFPYNPYTLGVRGANIGQLWVRRHFGEKGGVRREMQASYGLGGSPYTYYTYLFYKTLFLFYRRGLIEAGQRTGVPLYGI